MIAVWGFSKMHSMGGSEGPLWAHTSAMGHMSRIVGAAAHLVLLCLGCLGVT
jgi:hypothetical protein